MITPSLFINFWFSILSAILYMNHPENRKLLLGSVQLIFIIGGMIEAGAISEGKESSVIPKALSLFAITFYLLYSVLW